MADGFAPACDIHIAAIGTMPLWHTAFAPVFAWRLAIVVVASDTGFAKVVKTCPHDIADDVWIVANKSPVAERITRITLGLPHHTFGIALMVAGVLEYHIIIATDIEYIKVRIEDFPIAVPSTESLCHGASLVVIQDSLLQHLCSVYHSDVLALYHLVAYAPADDAGMVAVALNHGTDILLIT